MRDAGTLPDVSPRKAEVPSPEDVAAVRTARARRDEAHAQVDAEFRDTVRDVLTRSSVRTLADALGVSPTTVQAWSRD